MTWLKLWYSIVLCQCFLVKRCSWIHSQNNLEYAWRLHAWIWKHLSIALRKSRRGETGSWLCDYARRVCVWMEGTPSDRMGHRRSETPDSQNRN